ncbi:fructokinase, ribokinase_pfkB_like superfamily [Psychroflexus torquis ATCC 700755]|uniref:Fructokinase, ribokinase_pfkB_like superfamily n=1 Tax=Psychroflexus torquis (strain ATCC 700755 / CIP 106069 / ACAM 623) TaxID=313595 RepID=K4IEH6_PSYTT|nr:sugar kinase [Psychroflexus torquis]AFU68962.1 fructokinase, ribokinase_pfkB_like superfamily [Psychroflexus torquis ATCC 700755]
MLNNQLDIICVGEALVDFIGHEIGSISKTTNYQRHLGGSPTNVSLNLAKLKLKVALVATLGKDGLGDYILEGLQASNIDVSNVSISVLKPTSVIFISKTDATPEFIPYREADHEIILSQFKDVSFSGIRVFHTTCFALSKNPARETILKMAKKAYLLNCKLSIDLNYSNIIWPNKQEAISTLETFCAFNPLIKISEDDKRRLLGNISDDIMFEYFHKLGVDTICYTKGSKGVKLSVKGEKIIHMEALKIEKVVDATGAGDAFWSGFLYSYIRNYNYTNCLKFGLKLASLKLQSLGSSSFNPNIGEDFFQNNA